MSKTITLNHQFIACKTNPDAEHLTLIHGWAAENAVWSDWAEEMLAPHLNVHLIDLPGFGLSPEIEKPKANDSSEMKRQIFKQQSTIEFDMTTAWLDALAQSLPEKTHLLGWSLGGLLAQRLALSHPNQVQSLICLASTPRFTQLDGWHHAVSPELLGDFIKAMGIEYLGVLKQFWHLQLQGSENARQLMKKLTQQMRNRTTPSFSGLMQGLKLLRDLDNRDMLHDIQQPNLWIFGEHDPLIPTEIQQDLPKYQAQAKTQIIAGASHMPFFSHPEATAHAILSFIDTQTHANI